MAAPVIAMAPGDRGNLGLLTFSSQLNLNNHNLTTPSLEGGRGGWGIVGRDGVPVRVLEDSAATAAICAFCRELARMFHSVCRAMPLMLRQDLNTTTSCHSERSEESYPWKVKILRSSGWQNLWPSLRASAVTTAIGLWSVPYFLFPIPCYSKTLVFKNKYTLHYIFLIMGSYIWRSEAYA